MLDPKATYEKKETISFPLLKNDVYPVQLIDVVEEEKPKYQAEGTESKFTFEFAVLSGLDAEGNEARLRLLAKNFVPTFLYISHKTGKNWLYKIVEALIGRELTRDEEAEGLSGEFVNSLVGKQCRVILEKVASKKDATKFYSNISNVLPIEGNGEFSLVEEEFEKIKEAKARREENN
jgi:hypothetical protein